MSDGAGISRMRIPRVLVLLLSELAAVVALHSLGQYSWMRVDWGDLGGWIEETPAEDVLLASVRMVALVLAFWLLVSTVLYVGAALAGVPQAVRSVRWILVPGVGRLLDGLLALSVSSGALLASTATVGTASHETVTTSPEGTRADDTVPEEIAFKMAIYTAASRLPESAPHEATYMVQAGDSLWEIAEKRLGDPTRWRELWEANRQRLEEAGHTDVETLFIGWELLLPQGPNADPDVNNANVQGPWTANVDNEPPVVDLMDDRLGGDLLVVEPAATTTPAGDVPASESVSGSGGTMANDGYDTAGVDGAFGSTVAVPVGLIYGGIGVAGLLLLLERHRRAQQRHRRRGERIEGPDVRLTQLETELRHGAEVDSARFVDAALRAAAAGAGATGLPMLRWLEATSAGVVLVVDQPAQPPPGFVAEGPGRWRTAADVTELASIGADVSSPAPMLAAIGTTRDGTEVLVDFEALGVVAVSGDTEQVASWLRAVALSVATAPWAVQPQVISVGMGRDLERLPTVEEETSLSDALVMAEAHAERAASMLASLSCATTAQARAAGATPDAWEPLLVLSATPPTELDYHRLVGLASRRGHGAAVIAPHSGLARSAGVVCRVDSSGLVHLDGMDLVVQARRLDERDMQAVDLLEQATSPAVVTVKQQTAATAPGALNTPLMTLDDLSADVDVLVRVLGEVQVVRPGADGDEPVEVARQKGLETICYLAMRETTVDRDDLEIALFPSGANALKTFQNAVTSARKALGDDLFPSPRGGRYSLSDRVATDIGLFSGLARQADTLDDPEQAADMLAEALTLVSGEPFLGAGRGYSWIGPHKGVIVAEVIDAADELAEVRLEMGNWRGAEWAARQGLRAFPWDERMYRILMRCAHQAGNIPGVHRAYQELVTAISDPDDGVEPADTVHPETLDLLEQLTRRRPRRESA